MTRFICISGHAQNGKDTSAKMLESELASRGKSVLLVHYADLLKFICKSYFKWNGEKDEVGRTLLQKVGTDHVRKKNPNYWVDFVTGVVKMFPDEWDYVLVPDCRFPNEIKRVSTAGYDVTHVRIARRNFDSPLTEEQQKHESETALDSVLPDYWLTNDTLEQLRNDVSSLCDVILDNAKTQVDQYEQISIFDTIFRADGA